MNFTIPSGSIGLEAALREPKGAHFIGAALLCHPHPQRGGDMQNRVVYRAGIGALKAGFAALRFNYRGVGASTGNHDQGIGEQDDVKAAIDWLQEHYPEKPLVLIGYSFGAWVGLQVGCRDSRIAGLIGLGLPLKIYDFDFLTKNRKPSLYIVGSRDEYCGTEELERLAANIAAPSRVHRIEGGDHYFTRDVMLVQHLVAEFLGAREFGD